MLARPSRSRSRCFTSTISFPPFTVPAISSPARAVRPCWARFSAARSSFSQIRVYPPTRAAIRVPRSSDFPNAPRMASSCASTFTRRSASSSSRSSRETDAGTPRRPGIVANNETTRSVTFNSPGSSISESQRSKATAGTGIRWASRGIGSGRPDSVIYATDSS